MLSRRRRAIPLRQSNPRYCINDGLSIKDQDFRGISSTDPARTPPIDAGRQWRYTFTVESHATDAKSLVQRFFIK